MLTIATITDKARKTLQDTPNIFQIALIPVLISVSVQLFSSTRQSILEVYLSQDGSNLHFSYLLSSILFPIFYGLLMSLLYLSITWALFKGIKQGANEYRASSSLAIFQHEHFKKIFFTFILKRILLFLWGLIFYIGLVCFLGSIIYLSSFLLSQGSVTEVQTPYDILSVTGMLFFIGFLLMIIGLIIYLPQIYAYSQVETVLFDQLTTNDYRNPLSTVKYSRNLMKGYKRKRFLLDLHFIGWFLLSTITFGIVGIYVLPYYHAAQIHFYIALLEDQHYSFSTKQI